MADTLRVQVKRLPASIGLPLPTYQTAGAAGMDVLAALDDPVHIPPGGIVLIPTGLSLAIPTGWEAQVRPRSGLAVRHGITLPNAPATIDSDYRGEVLVPLINLGPDSFTIERGMRVAQIVFAPVATAVWIEVDTLESTARGEAGFGHTGVR